MIMCVVCGVGWRRRGAGAGGCWSMAGPRGLRMRRRRRRRSLGRSPRGRRPPSRNNLQHKQSYVTFLLHSFDTVVIERYAS